eukprot:jgi/Bigna1/132787/aug1.19_g7495
MDLKAFKSKLQNHLNGKKDNNLVVDILEDLQKRAWTVKSLKEISGIGIPKIVSKMSKKESEVEIKAKAAALVKVWMKLIKKKGKAPTPVKKGGQVSSTGNPKRDRICKAIFGSLGTSVKAASKAEEIERCMFRHFKGDNSDYVAFYREVVQSFRDPGNRDLKEKVLKSEIEAAVLVTYEVKDFASSEVMKKRAAAKEEKKLAVKSTFGKPKYFSTQFKCGKCKKSMTDVNQKQTRSGDEPMTLFITCLNCNNKWKQ